MCEAVPFAVPVDALRPLIREIVVAMLAEIGTSNESPLLMTEAEAATKLGMSPDTLRSERRLGRITFRQRGRKIQYSPEDLAQYVARIRA
jgi:hypothetical protein